jgi:hypothetical protein
MAAWLGGHRIRLENWGEGGFESSLMEDWKFRVAGLFMRSLLNASFSSDARGRFFNQRVLELHTDTLKARPF